MSNRTISLTDDLYEYLLSVTLTEDGVLRQCREETARLKYSRMQISPEQGQFMAILLKLISARQVIELGTFTGYSSICMARALPVDGRVICCDVSREYTDIAAKYWKAAAIEEKIDLRLAPALHTLESLQQDGRQGSIDFVFIDAVKEEYLDYYNHCFELVRSGGLIAVDNTLWDGRVADPQCNDCETMAIREFNTYIHHDDRVESILVPIGDGLNLIRKK